MITCYPGNGSHYNKHCDNPLKNGRKLTCILYLNKEWKQSDGGQLKMFHNDDNYILIDPLLNRLVIFWSDIRCLHEVFISFFFIPLFIYLFIYTNLLILQINIVGFTSL